MALHDNLKQARSRRGMSQELVAERLEVSRQAVTKWESGQSRPNARNLQALAELYQTSSEELLREEEQKQSNLILRANLTKWAIIFHTAFLNTCTQYIYMLRVYPHDRVYQGVILFSLVLLMICSIWMAMSHRYEPDVKQRRKSGKIELIYCSIQIFIALLTNYRGMGLTGAVLMIGVCSVYILYINPKFMNRRFTR